MLSGEIDFPATGINTSGWQLTLIDMADSLDMLDADTLRNEHGNRNLPER